MPRKLAFPTAVLAALTLVATACDEQPTEVQNFSIDGVAFSFIGYTGSTADAPESATSVEHSIAFPSTNDANIGKGWANVTWNSNDAGVGEAPLKFVHDHNFVACFEIRVDNAPPASATNYNTHVTDGLWDFRCVGGGYGTTPIAETFNATSHVDVRMAFGAERDERFDWTRFYVMSLNSKEQCRNSGWQDFGFANQGQCIRYIETGKK